MTQTRRAYQKKISSIRVKTEYAELLQNLATALDSGKISPVFLDIELLKKIEKYYGFLYAFKDNENLFSEDFVGVCKTILSLLSHEAIGYSILQESSLLAAQKRENDFYENMTLEEEPPEQQEIEYYEEDVSSIEQIEIAQISSKKLKKSQEKAMIALKKFTYNTEQKYLKLCGYAGTGKTFLIVEYLRWLRVNRVKFVAASPTNKALKNLVSIADEAGLEDIRTHTVAQLLGQQPVLNKKTGKEEFISGKAHNKIDLESFDVAVIDEYSMINSKNYQELIGEAECSDLKLVIVGDSMQLPPVGEQEPAVDLSDDIDKTLELLEIVRYDGEIAKVAEEIRSDEKWNKRGYPFVTTEDKTIVSLPRIKWMTRAGEFFKSKQDVRFIVFRNKVADELNRFVRLQLWGNNCDPYCIGDRLIARTPVFAKIGIGKVSEDCIIINNSEECTVLCEPTLKTYVEGSIKEGELEYYQVRVKADDGATVDLQILTPQSEIKRGKILKKYKDEKQWNLFQQLSKYFDNMPFAYALTTHKAQGSSIDFTFLDLPDLNRCSDRQKILYTALTRAKKQAFICQ
ncbi:MAG: AAA family ATPase [Prochloraceae cyanobacterium]|nr:AAA family ATPase [Prochloraceae cyanobacterium]